MPYFRTGLIFSIAILGFGIISSAASASDLVDPAPDRVMEWFRKYDQIRRDAEMTTGDKLQSLLLSSTKPSEKNAALASRMIEKYTNAASKMKSELQPIPETRELHEGYAEYFNSGRRLFADYLEAQKVVPFTTKSLVPIKKEMEKLDKANKKIDSQLRKQYRIARHKHS